MKKLIYLVLITLCFQNLYAQDTYDRSKQPVPGPAPLIGLPDPYIFRFPNGMTLLVVENHRLPRVTASLYVDAGPVAEGSKAGVYSLMGMMLNEGTRDLPKAEFDRAVDQIGASMNLTATGGQMEVLTRYFPRAIELMSKAVRQPLMTEEAFEKLKSQTLTSKQNEEKSVSAISGKVVNALLFGRNHPLGEFDTYATIKSISLADVKRYYADYMTPSRSYLTIVGDIKPEQAKELVQRYFASWQGRKLSLPKFAHAAELTKPRIALVDVASAVQSQITIANVTDLSFKDADIYATELANSILGGGSNAYLFQALREKRRFTYGAYSSIGTGRFQQTFKADAAVRTAKADSAVNEFLVQIGRIRTQPVGEQALTIAKAKYNGSFALNMEVPENIAFYALRIMVNDLPKDYFRTYLQKINQVSVPDVQRAAAKHFSANPYVVVVGNASAVREPLKRLPYQLTEFDRYAEPVQLR